MLVVSRILCGIDAIIATILVVFFVWGLADGTLSAFNIGLWLLVFGVVAVILGGGITLNRNGQRGSASLLLAVLAVPGLLSGLLLLLVLVLQPDFK